MSSGFRGQAQRFSASLNRNTLQPHEMKRRSSAKTNAMLRAVLHPTLLDYISGRTVPLALSLNMSNFTISSESTRAERSWKLVVATCGRCCIPRSYPFKNRVLDPG